MSTVIRQAISQFIETADRLRALAEILDGFSDTRMSAEPAELRLAAIGIQAAATQVILTGATALGLSERLATIASIRDENPT